ARQPGEGAVTKLRPQLVEHLTSQKRAPPCDGASGPLEFQALACASTSKSCSALPARAKETRSLSAARRYAETRSATRRTCAAARDRPIAPESISLMIVLFWEGRAVPAPPKYGGHEPQQTAAAATDGAEPLAKSEAAVNARRAAALWLFRNR